jgi:hypothetical protein
VLLPATRLTSLRSLPAVAPGTSAGRPLRNAPTMVTCCLSDATLSSDAVEAPDRRAAVSYRRDGARQASRGRVHEEVNILRPRRRSCHRRGANYDRASAAATTTPGSQALRTELIRTPW